MAKVQTSLDSVLSLLHGLHGVRPPSDGVSVYQRSPVVVGPCE